MWNSLQDFWDGCVNLFILWAVIVGTGVALQMMKWKYEPGTKQRDLGMFKSGVGIARAFFGK